MLKHPVSPKIAFLIAKIITLIGDKKTRKQAHTKSFDLFKIWKYRMQAPQKILIFPNYELRKLHLLFKTFKFFQIFSEIFYFFKIYDEKATTLKRIFDFSKRKLRKPAP